MADITVPEIEVPDIATVVTPDLIAAFAADLTYDDSLFTDTLDVLAPDRSITEVSIVTPEATEEPSYLNNIPDLPTIRDIVLPLAPAIDHTIRFEGTLPDFVAPERLPTFQYTEPDYIPTMYDNIVEWLNSEKNELDLGLKTGLSAAVEAAIFGRARSRQQALNEKAYNEVSQYFAARGFALPTGAMAARIAMVLREQTRADALLSNEIMIKQAELELTNAHFIKNLFATTSMELEKTTRAYSSQVAQRLLDSAKAALDAGTLVVQAMTARYNAMVEAYKIDSVIYESRLKNELAKIELYRAEVEGAKVEATISQTESESYKNSMQAAMFWIELYKARITERAGSIEVEKLKIEKVKADIAVYDCDVRKMLAEIEGKGLLLKRDTGKAGYAAERVKIAMVEVDRMRAESQLKSEDCTRQKINLDAEIEHAKLFTSASIEGARLLTSANTEEARIESSETIEGNRISSTELIEENRISSAETIDANHIAATETIESRKDVTEIHLSDDRLASAKELQGLQITSTEYIEDGRIASVEKIEGNRITATETIESRKDVTANSNIVSAYKIAKNEVSAKNFASKVEAFKAEVSSDASNKDNITKVAGINADLQKAEADILIKNAEIQMRLATSNAEIAKTSAQAGANLAAQIVSSALTAVHVAISEGYTGSVQQSYSVTNSEDVADAG